MPTQHYRLIGERLAAVRERIAAAAGRAGREPGSVRIVAVTKGHPLEAVEAVLAAGVPDIGENRVEELERKLAAMRDLGGARWHMIGHVQSRKASRAARLAELVHSVDSLRLAAKLSRTGEALGRRVPVLVQINASGEAAKSGFPRAEVQKGIEEVASLPGLRALGLMTMAPLTSDERVLRATFRRTREVLEAASEAGCLEGRELSMGMSNDFEVAVEEGSTMVRLGTTLVGKRPL